MQSLSSTLDLALTDVRDVTPQMAQAVAVDVAPAAATPSAVVDDLADSAQALAEHGLEQEDVTRTAWGTHARYDHNPGVENTETGVHVERPDDGPDVVRPEDDGPSTEEISAMFEELNASIDEAIADEQDDTFWENVGERAQDVGEWAEQAAKDVVDGLVETAEALGGDIADAATGIVDAIQHGFEGDNFGEVFGNVLDTVLFDPIDAVTGGLVDINYDDGDFSAEVGAEDVFHVGMSVTDEGAWDVDADVGIGKVGRLQASLGEDEDGNFHTDSDLELHIPTQYGTVDIAASGSFEELDGGGFRAATEGTIGITSAGGQQAAVGLHASTENDGAGNSETTVGVHQIVGQVGVGTVRVDEDVVIVEEDGEYQGTRGEVSVTGDTIFGDFHEEATVWDATDDQPGSGRRGGGADPEDDGPDVVRPEDDGPSTEEILAEMQAALDAVDDAIDRNTPDTPTGGNAGIDPDDLDIDITGPRIPRNALGTDTPRRTDAITDDIRTTTGPTARLDPDIGPDVVRPEDDGPDVVRPEDDGPSTEEILAEMQAALDAVDDAIDRNTPDTPTGGNAGIDPDDLDIDITGPRIPRNALGTDTPRRTDAITDDIRTTTGPTARLDPDIGPDVVRPEDDGPDVVRPEDDGPSTEEILAEMQAALDAVDDAIDRNTPDTPTGGNAGIDPDDLDIDITGPRIPRNALGTDTPRRTDAITDDIRTTTGPTARLDPDIGPDVVRPSEVGNAVGGIPDIVRPAPPEADTATLMEEEGITNDPLVAGPAGDPLDGVAGLDAEADAPGAGRLGRFDVDDRPGGLRDDIDRNDIDRNDFDRNDLLEDL